MVNVGDDAGVSDNGWVFHQFNNFFCLPITRHTYSFSIFIMLVIFNVCFLII